MNFVEITMSMLILSILLLGVNAAQWAALKQHRVNYYFALASNQVNSLKEYTEHSTISVNDVWVSNWKLHTKKILPQANITLHKKNHQLYLNMSWGTNKNTCKIRANHIKKNCMTLNLP